jgi:hypothetical protein
MLVSCQLHTPAALPRGKSPRYPLDRRLGGPQSWSGRCDEKNLALPGIEPGPSSPSLYGQIHQFLDFRTTVPGTSVHLPLPSPACTAGERFNHSFSINDIMCCAYCQLDVNNKAYSIIFFFFLNVTQRRTWFASLSVFLKKKQEEWLGGQHVRMWWRVLRKKKTHLLFFAINNNKFWEEIIAYFTMIRYGPHEKKKDASNNSSLPRERL